MLQRRGPARPGGLPVAAASLHGWRYNQSAVFLWRHLTWPAHQRLPPAVPKPRPAPRRAHPTIQGRQWTSPLSPPAMIFCSTWARPWAVRLWCSRSSPSTGPCAAWRAPNAPRSWRSTRARSRTCAPPSTPRTRRCRAPSCWYSRKDRRRRSWALPSRTAAYSPCCRPRSSRARPRRCSRTPWRRRCRPHQHPAPPPLRCGSAPSPLSGASRSSPGRSSPAADPGWC